MFRSLGIKALVLYVTITNKIWFINGQSVLSPEQVQVESATTVTVTEDGSITTNDDSMKIKSDQSIDGWNWNRIMASDGDGRQPIIVSNGNVWPPTNDEDANDCLILATRNQLMWHCPEGDDASYERHILYRAVTRVNGLFSAPGTDRRRLWVLDCPGSHDAIIEVDTVTGYALQTLVIDQTRDGHDLVRVNDTAFLVDTRNGHIVEFEVPASAPPYTESSIQAGAKPVTELGFVNIIKRHTGFTREDHINNVAIHPDLLITNLHGGTGIKAKVANQTAPSPTRLSALLRSMPHREGKELNYNTNGFTPISNVGTMCHGIAFWNDDAKSQIKLISLDSMNGSMVSVVLTGPNEGERDVLWTPDLDHPVLNPPKGVASVYMNGAKVFSKGLAVQGGVAYFSVSYARRPILRRTVPETLLVAVDLSSKKELFARTVRSNGLINQIITQSYLGWAPQLPSELSTIEITLHGVGGRMVKSCEDVNDADLDDDFCKEFENDTTKCRSTEKSRSCCACHGGVVTKTPLMAGTLDGEVLNIDEDVTATATFIQNPTCLDRNGTTKRLSLESKAIEYIPNIQNVDKDLNSIVKHICNLNVKLIAERLLKLDDEAFTDTYQVKNGNSILTGQDHELRPVTKSIHLIARDIDTLYHFPWLDDWLPMIQELVLDPIGLTLNNVIHMMFTQIPKESTINIHREKNLWVQKSHRVHIPIITHKDVFFLTETQPPSDGNETTIEDDYDYDYEEKNQILRIKSNSGEAYEFNNAMLHGERNLGESRVDLILDWIENPTDQNEKYILMKPKPGERLNNW